MDDMNMKAKRYILPVVSGAAALSCTADVDEKPNIILIVADDLGYADVGCYGQDMIETPCIDGLASLGMRFTQHYSGTAVSAPSRSSLMTGMHTGNTPIRDNVEFQPEGQQPLFGEIVTMADMLGDAGYVTGAFGKWGLGAAGSEGDPNSRGFDEFFGYICQRQSHRYFPEHLWHNGEKVVINPSGEPAVNYSCDAIHKKAIEFIEDNKSKPFFMFYPCVLPHAELLMPEGELMNKYRGRFEETPFGGTGAGSEYGSPDFNVACYCPQPEPRATFAAMVNQLDEYVGDIVKCLERNGLADNTIIIFTSDNGPHEEGGADPAFFKSNGGLRGIKRDLYEGGIRVPFVVRWPGKIAEGCESDLVSAFWDIMPTLAEIGGAELPENADGLSLVPVLTGNADAQKEHDYLYWEFHAENGKQAVRKGDWKAVKLNVKSPDKTVVELYDLASDPYERNNVAAEHPDIVMQLTALMDEAHHDNEVFTL